MKAIKAKFTIIYHFLTEAEVVVEETLFQLRIGPVSYCVNWSVSKFKYMSVVVHRNDFFNTHRKKRPGTQKL